MKYLVFSFILVLISIELSGQNYDTRFALSSINCETKQVCYHVQLRPNGAGSFNLAGQNYRIFYNSSLASFTSGQSLLPSQYGEYTMVQNVQGANAGEMNGPLDFEATLGFLNYAVDLNDTQNGGINLPANEWTSTSNLCFTVEYEVLNNINSCIELIWGRAGLTDMYATAFVEVSRWVSTNNTTNSNGIDYDDLGADDGASSCLVLNCQPNAISVSDVTIDESMGGAQVQVCIAAATTENITINITTSDSTAVSPNDYTASTNAMITIPVGQTCSTILIPITNDTISETSEIFKVALTNPSSNASIGDGYALVTIVDDEAIPTVSIQDVAVNEDTTVATISICLSGLSALPTTMTFNTSDSTAVAGSDFVGIEDLAVTIPSGALCTTIEVNIIDNLILESTEYFGVLLSNLSPNATFSDDTAVVTILDNDTVCQAKAPVITGN
jgi:Calx-beta domain